MKYKFNEESGSSHPFEGMNISWVHSSGGVKECGRPSDGIISGGNIRENSYIQLRLPNMPHDTQDILTTTSFYIADLNLKGLSTKGMHLISHEIGMTKDCVSNRLIPSRHTLLIPLNDFARKLNLFEHLTGVSLEEARQTYAAAQTRRGSKKVLISEGKQKPISQSMQQTRENAARQILDGSRSMRDSVRDEDLVSPTAMDLGLEEEAYFALGVVSETHPDPSVGMVFFDDLDESEPTLSAVANQALTPPPHSEPPPLPPAPPPLPG